MAGDVDLILLSAKVLFANGQTTERTVVAVEQLAEALGLRVTLVSTVGRTDPLHPQRYRSRYEIIAAAPLGVDMSKVVATMSVIDKVCAGRMDIEAARLHPGCYAISTRLACSLRVDDSSWSRGARGDLRVQCTRTL